MTLLSIEHEINYKLSYDDIIDEFTIDPRKNRCKQVYHLMIQLINIQNKMHILILNKIINHFIRGTFLLKFLLLKSVKQALLNKKRY